mmetsp:Transcript_27332/g.44857  ORF Transcript_27332/g.44857 Transcript_27332/m.44857 type:complete len:139 (-) Transcript_27332:98-514(-)
MSLANNHPNLNHRITAPLHPLQKINPSTMYPHHPHLPPPQPPLPQQHQPPPQQHHQPPPTSHHKSGPVLVSVESPLPPLVSCPPSASVLFAIAGFNIILVLVFACLSPGPQQTTYIPENFPPPAPLSPNCTRPSLVSG